MKRTQFYITEEIKETLDKLSHQRGKSKIIREAISEYISRHSEIEKKKLKIGAGLWKERSSKKATFLSKETS